MARMNKIHVIGFSLVIALLPFILQRWGATAYYVDVLVFVAIHSILAMGLALLIGFAGQISLGHAAFYGIGAYASGLLTTRASCSPWLAIVAGVIIAGLTAYVIGVPSLKLHGHYLAMATLGAGVIVSVVFNEAVWLTGGPSGFGEIPPLTLLGIEVNNISYYYFSWAVAIAVLILSLNIVNSRVGRALRAIRDSELAAMSSGINTSRFKLQIFVLSGIYGSIAGSLYAHFVTFINPPPFDVFFSVKLLMMVCIGGMQSIWGAIAGAALLTFLPEWLTFLQDFDILAYGVLLLVIIVFFPDGLSGLIKTFISAFRRTAINI
ncbi:MAG: branched-chain amino acid ABC transporter permease [Deltaproteobacteria bacterium]|nr:branched-chain amino acid ABC transporter permease [Deltaproteobacteria bacterium]